MARATRIGLRGRVPQWYRRYADGMSRNVQILIATEPLWAVPVNWTKTYASLFMAALGLGAVQIGWLTSLTLIVQTVVAPFGGYVADRFGRKKALIFFDTLSWAIPMFVWMVAKDYRYFVVAAILNGTNAIVWPAWNCLLVEDTRPSRRSAVFASFQLVVLGAGVLSPIAGWIVKGYDVISGTRILYAVAGISIGIMILYRAFTVQETSVGSMRVRELRGTTLRDYLIGYREVFVQGRRNHVLVALFFLGIINLAYVIVWGAYASLYMTHDKGLGIAPEVVSVWPTFLSLVMIVTLVIGVPRIRLEHLSRWLVSSFLLLCLGLGLFLLAPKGSVVPLILSALLIGTGTALFNPVRDTFLANIIEDKDRAALMAGMNSLSMLVVIPLTPLAGKFFELSPQAPLILLEVLFILGFVLCLALRRGGSAAGSAAGTKTGPQS